MLWSSAVLLTLVGAVASGVVVMVMAEFNPCASPAEGCGTNFGSNNTCGYGSVCVSVLGNRATGHCAYQTPNITCGGACPLLNSTEFALGTYPEETTCEHEATCARRDEDERGTCGGPGQFYRSVNCSCTANNQCATGACSSDGLCVPGIIKLSPGYPCLTDSDCNNLNGCVNGTCATIAGFNESCAASYECHLNLSCSGQVPPHSRCYPNRQIGESCSLDNRDGLVCASHAVCNNLTNTCYAQHTLPEGAVCFSSSECAIGLGCKLVDPNLLKRVCSANYTCEASGKGCPFGQTCGCPADGSATPTCVGAIVPESFVVAKNAYQQCLARYAETKAQLAFPIPARTVPQNYVQIPSQCRCEFKRIYCDAENAALIGTLLSADVDYRLVDCCRGQWKPYDSNRTESCEVGYCHTQFDSSMVESCPSTIEDPCPADESGSTSTAPPVLSAGAIAAIAIGSVAGIAAVAGMFWLAGACAGRPYVSIPSY